MNVDEQTSYDGVKGLIITATLTDGDTIISTQQTHYSDTVITFRSISAGDYTCSVTVEDETGPVESVHIPCTVGQGEEKHYKITLYIIVFIDGVTECPTCSSSPLVVGMSVGVVCSVCFLLIGVLIGVLASHKCKKASHEGQSAVAPPPPVYEEVESRSGQVKVHKKEEFQFEKNAAYGHVKQ